ncbi:MAG: glycerophosphodiester phosphodiesterase family protein [Pseudomonadota bacterium]
MHPSLKALIERPIAHRGLHDGNVATYENSRSAFDAAISRNYGIELDVQLSADGVAVVFHDETLDRLTVETGPVRARSAKELGTVALGATTDTIETLGAILSMVDGRVPVVIELKENGTDNAELVASVVEAVAIHAAKAALSVMSFSQDIIARLRAAKIVCPIGLTAEGLGTKAHETHRLAFKHDIEFVSYQVTALPNDFLSDVRARGMPVITWTVRTPQQLELTRAHADQATFEGFRP